MPKLTSALVIYSVNQILSDAGSRGKAALTSIAIVSYYDAVVSN